jgi:hypothetical protein
VATRSVAERRRATSIPLPFKLQAPPPERPQAIRAAWAVAAPRLRHALAVAVVWLRHAVLVAVVWLRHAWAVAAPKLRQALAVATVWLRHALAVAVVWLRHARVALEPWGARMAGAVRDAHLPERARELGAACSRWVALGWEQVRQTWRRRQALLAARREAVISGRAKPLTADDPTWKMSAAAARIEFHDAPDAVTLRAMPSAPLPEHLWRQWHQPAADRVPQAPPLRTTVALALAAGIVVVALSAVTYGVVARNWRGLPSFSSDAAPIQKILIHPVNSPTPSLGQPPYFLGAWVSDSSPQPASMVTVYVRMTNSVTQDPVPGVAVTVYARLCQNGGGGHTFGPATTGADGLATLQVSFEGLQVGQPICLTASAALAGQTYTADTTFTAASPAKPTATPTSSDASGGGDGKGGGGGGGFPFPTPTPTPLGHGRP